MLPLAPRPCRRLAHLLAGLAAAAPAADRAACASRLITTGMPDSDVRAACGEPAAVGHDTILRRPTIRRQGGPLVVGGEREPVPVARWRHDLGPNRLMLRPRFDDGVPVEVTTLGCGSNP